jgi:hypothetical protein
MNAFLTQIHVSFNQKRSLLDLVPNESRLVNAMQIEFAEGPKNLDGKSIKTSTL